MVLEKGTVDNKELIATTDGSLTLYVKNLGEPYHSLNGALTESRHVFIKNGLLMHQKTNLTVFEVGFGTGLNCLLTALESSSRNIHIRYIGIDKFPLDGETLNLLNYPSLIGGKAHLFWDKIHSAKWNKETKISGFFNLLKLEQDIADLHFSDLPEFDVVFFDAFGPDKQPEIWDVEIFRSIFNCCSSNAIFTTYSAKGEVRRKLIEVGFKIERVPGPPGKKEMLRGIKTI
jgi:tRNA U34 5-methylaminomethyl-2-thiouridine-forming methyltransferase MnmC